MILPQQLNISIDNRWLQSRHRTDFRNGDVMGQQQYDPFIVAQVATNIALCMIAVPSNVSFIHALFVKGDNFRFMGRTHTLIEIVALSNNDLPVS